MQQGAITEKLKRRINVSGWQNNCGANVFMHAYLDHWDTLPFQDPRYKSLLKELTRPFSMDMNPNTLKKTMDSLNPLEQEFAFGSSVRNHIFHILGQQQEYRDSLFQSFQVAIFNSVAGFKIEPTDHKFILSNQAIIHDCKEVFAYLIKELDIDLKSLSPEDKESLMDQMWHDLDAFIPSNQQGSWLENYWNTQGFKSTLNYMTDYRNSYMMTQDELERYAKSMDIGLNVINRNAEQTLEAPLYASFLDLTLVNSGLHWQYLAPETVSEKEIQQRNAPFEQAPGDRTNQFNALLEHPDRLGDQDMLKVLAPLSTIKPSSSSKLLHWNFCSMTYQKPYREANQQLNDLLDKQGELLDQKVFEEAFDQASQALRKGLKLKF